MKTTPTFKIQLLKSFNLNLSGDQNCLNKPGTQWVLVKRANVKIRLIVSQKMPGAEKGQSVIKFTFSKGQFSNTEFSQVV